MNETPQGERVRIVLVGRCNAGKSSLINALAGQSVAIVSSVKGTTTDPVRKAMELLPVGPVLLCDTPGLDDAGNLGTLRMEKTREEIRRADLAIIVADAVSGITEDDRKIASEISDLKVPAIVVMNKVDISSVCGGEDFDFAKKLGFPVIPVSCKNGIGIEDVKFQIIKSLPELKRSIHIASDFVKSGDVVLLVVPIDSAAPKGRLILPQQQTIRDLLDNGAIPVVVRDSELRDALGLFKSEPALVITDSQAFEGVAKIVPPTIPLTSFSILFARYKGDIGALVNGAKAIESLKDGDRVLIAEGCTHHRQCNDIGTVKIPMWLREKTGKNLIIETSSGMQYPENLGDFALIVHCGGCMLNMREMVYRIERAKAKGIPIVNYGVLIAYLHGILPRATEIIEKGEGTGRKDGRKDGEFDTPRAPCRKVFVVLGERAPRPLS